MKKETKIKANSLVPKLRFPEFVDAGDWMENLFGSLGDFTGGGTPSKQNDSYWRGNNPWISSSDVSDESIYEINISRYISDEAIQETATKLIPANSILIVSRVGVGKLAITKSQVCTSQDFTNFTPRKDDIEFIAYYLKTLKNKFIAMNQGMAIKGFTKEDVCNLSLYIPSLPEQQKIADCLSSLDDLIQLETKKWESLKSYRKGLLQKLFPAEGETVPELRFPEFEGTGDWEDRKLGEVCFEISSGKNKSNANGEFDLYGSTGIIGKTSDGEYQGKTILVARVGANAGLLTMADGKFGVTDNTLVLKLRNNVGLDFIYNILLFKNLNTLVFGSGQPLITGGQLKNLLLSIPSLPEQQKIADCLSSVDSLIQEQAEKIERLQSHKKGLLQGLFPAMGEFEGYVF